MATKSSGASRRQAGGNPKINKVMREYKTGTLKSGTGGKVMKRKQAVAIALNEARKSGAKIPPKKAHRPVS